MFPVHRPHPVPLPASPCFSYCKRDSWGGGLVERNNFTTSAALKRCCRGPSLSLANTGLMSLREFYRHISTCRNVYCKLCGCSTSPKHLLKCKFSATNNNNNCPPACMSRPFPGWDRNRKFIWSGLRVESLAYAPMILAC